MSDSVRNQLKMIQKQIYQSGQSLLEVVVVIGVVVLLTTGLLTASTVALRGSQYGTAKTDAVKLVSEGLELVRNDRDKGWTAFLTRDRKTGTTIDYYICSDSTFQTSTCSIPLAGREYTRSTIFLWDSINTRMETTVTVTWNEGGTTQTSQLKSFFTDWK